MAVTPARPKLSPGGAQALKLPGCLELLPSAAAQRAAEAAQQSPGVGRGGCRPAGKPMATAARAATSCTTHDRPPAAGRLEFYARRLGYITPLCITHPKLQAWPSRAHSFPRPNPECKFQ
jgi:hypothetical protein